MPTRPPTNNQRRPRPATPDGRASASQRGYGARWQRLRAAYLRANPVCDVCDRGRGHVRAATEVHHVTAKRDGGSDEWGNLMALCKSCHSRITARERMNDGHGNYTVPDGETLTLDAKEEKE